jgi:hypothetical protein
MKGAMDLGLGEIQRPPMTRTTSRYENVVIFPPTRQTSLG